MKIKIYRRKERWFPSETKWFTTKEAAYNFGRNDEWQKPEEFEVTATAWGFVKFLNRLENR